MTTPVRRRLASFGHAFRGIGRLIATQWNARFHLAAMCIVIAAGFLLRLDAVEWSLVALAMGLVWTAEAVNTAIEFLLDRVSPDPHPLIRDAKDLAAGAVLLAAIAALVIGLLIFLPKLL